MRAGRLGPLRRVVSALRVMRAEDLQGGGVDGRIATFEPVHVRHLHPLLAAAPVEGHDRST